VVLSLLLFAYLFLRCWGRCCSFVCWVLTSPDRLNKPARGLAIIVACSLGVDPGLAGTDLQTCSVAIVAGVQ
jgi:hypothetical protein